MRGNSTIAVIIPAMNEAGAVARVIGDIPQWGARIIVADNGSTDATIDIARAAGADIVSEPEPGYGAACLKGIDALGNEQVIVFLDGDYSDHPEQMDRLVDPIVNDTHDLVIGSRVTGNADPGSLTLPQRFGNRLACFLMRNIWGAQFTDLGPFRAIQRSALDAIGMQDRAFGWTVEMQIKAVEAGLRTHEVPVDYRPRIGVSKVSGTVRGTVLAGTTILRIIGVSGLQRLFRHRE